MNERKALEQKIAGAILHSIDSRRNMFSLGQRTMVSINERILKQTASDLIDRFSIPPIKSENKE